MIDINLLPSSQKQKRLALTAVTYITLGFVVIVVLFVGFAITLTTIKITITDKINTLNDQTLGLNKRLTDFKQLQSDVTHVNSGLKAAGAVVARSMQPDTLLDLIASKTGPNITLTALTLAHGSATAGKPVSATDPLQATITGTANDRSDIIKFKRALETDSHFSAITYTIGSSGTSANATSFTINATIPAATTTAKASTK